jgi:hypothetical protein
MCFHFRTANLSDSYVYKVLSYQSSDFLLEAGVEVSKDPLIIIGKFLAVPKVKFGRESLVSALTCSIYCVGANLLISIFYKLPSNGAWNLRNQTLSKTGKLDHWVLVCFEFNIQNQLQGITQEIMSACTRLGKPYM